MYKRCVNKENRSLYPVAALLVTTLLPLTCCIKILTFSAGVHESDIQVFVKESDVMLLCKTEGFSSIQINRLGDETPLNVSQGREQSLTYLIRSVTCEDMGTYECVVDHAQRQTTDLIVSECGPRPCPGDDVNRTKFVDVNQTVQLYLCVLAYPDKFEFIKFNNTSVRKKTPSNWTWDYQEIQSSTGPIKTLINISISRDQMVSEDYGLLNIRVYSSSGTQYYLVYNIWLLAPGPPECPAEVRAKGDGPNNVSLSWTPGFDGGSKQWFHVYSSKDNMTWYRHDVTGEENSTTVTGLEKNTTYYFRVVSSNLYRTDIDEHVCENTTFAETVSATKDKIESRPTDSRILQIIMPVVAFIVVLMLVLVFVLWILRVRKQRQTRRGKTKNSRKHNRQQLAVNNGRQLESGDYISPEGLKYISVYHVRDMLKKKKVRRKEKRRKDNIVYADLDFTKSGKTQL